MQVEFRKSFQKDLIKITDGQILLKIRKVIEQIEQVENLHELNQVKKIQGETNYYRIRVGNYRIGVKVSEGIVFFIRILHRKEIYRYFP